MPINSITFNRNKSGLGTPSISRDIVSALLFYNTVPVAFGAGNIKKIFSLAEAEALGILATGTYQCEWYHIREFFQKSPKGELYVGIYPIPGTPATHSFIEVQTMQVFAGGEIRQLGVFYPHAAYSASVMTGALQAVANTLENNNMPLVIVLAPDVSAVTDLTTLVALTTFTNKNVAVTIGQDGGGKGKALYDALDYSITDLGAKIGAISASKVHENIAWVEAFPMVTDGLEFDTIAFGNGKLYTEMTFGQVSSLDTLGYIFLVKHQGISGSFNNDSYTCIVHTNDLYNIERNRTIDKAIRNVRASLLPKLASPLYVNEDGTLTLDTIMVFKSLSDRALKAMEAGGELSASQTIINAEQNVVSTSTLTIALELVPVGVARSIVVNIGFTAKLS